MKEDAEECEAAHLLIDNMMVHKPFSQACENNQAPILEVIVPYFSAAKHVLEIGSGTGQHAVYLAARLAHLVWQTSDLPDQHVGIQAWLSEAALSNVRAPLLLDVTAQRWPVQNTEGVFSANTTHIMPWSAVCAMFDGIGKILNAQAYFCLYGPFNYGGQFTSASNARFDAWLKQQDACRGIRDIEALEKLAQAAAMQLVADHAMPANNRLLVWQRR